MAKTMMTKITKTMTINNNNKANNTNNKTNAHNDQISVTHDNTNIKHHNDNTDCEMTSKQAVTIPWRRTHPLAPDPHNLGIGANPWHRSQPLAPQPTLVTRATPWCTGANPALPFPNVGNATLQIQSQQQTTNSDKSCCCLCCCHFG